MYHTHPWNINLHIILFYTTISLLLFFSPNSLLTSRASSVSYSDHCTSFVPEPTHQKPIQNGNFTLDFLPGFLVTGKPDVPRPSPMYEFSSFYGLNLGYYETNVQDLFGAEARISLLSRRTSFYWGNISWPSDYSSSMHHNGTRNYHRSYFKFFLQGFWSQSHGKLCMVGEGSIRRKFKHFPVILKLDNLYNSTNITSLITGSLESLVDSGQNGLNHFNPISFVLFPRLNYEYSLVLQELVDSDATNSGIGSDVSLSLPLNSLREPFCHLIINQPFSLKYTRNCKSTSSAKKCNPLGDFISRLPSFVMLEAIECFKTPERPRLLIKFPVDDEMWNLGTLNFLTTFIGEGIWDAKKNALFVVACPFLNTTDSWAVARVSDCSTRLSLSFPAVWTIGNTSSIVGRIWSTKSAMESGYFEEIRFHSYEGRLAGSPDMKYEYTKIDQVKKWCPIIETAKKREGVTYQHAFLFEMTFDVRSKWQTNGTARIGYVQPIAIGNRIFTRQLNLAPSNVDFPESFSDVTYPAKISYRISLFNMSGKIRGLFDISAEGIYDNTTGSLCMVGCRHVGLNSSDLSSDNDTLDCEILVNFQFPARNAAENEGFIKGSIESKRETSDPLYFKSLNLSSVAYVAFEAQKSVWKADLEIVLALISNTLSCAFAVLQIFHLRRNPGLCPFVSLTMLSTLTFGHSVLLMMNLKSMLTSSFETEDVLLGAGGWLNTKAVTEGITGLMLFLLQARLLQLVWSSRISHENQSSLRIAESEALVASLPMFLGGASLSVMFAWSKKNHNIAVLSFSLMTSYNENPLWDALKSYANLLLDGFLFPQILINIFVDSRGESLSCFFYIGTTLVRVLPHAYALYKAQNSAFSTAWDVLVPLVSLLLASVIYLQQKFGSRCIL